MIVSALALYSASALGTPPVALTVSLSKPSYKPGEEVQSIVKLVNNSGARVVVSTVGSQYYPHASLSFRVYDSSGKSLNINRGGPQWMVSNEISPGIFAKIAPHGALTIATDAFKDIWTVREPHLKSEIAALPRAALTPGTYRVVYEYSFYRSLSPTDKAGHFGPPGVKTIGDEAYTFQKGAKALYDHAVTGRLKAVAEFTVAG